MTNRYRNIIIGISIVGLILIGRLFTIQILEDKYKIDASNNSMVYDIIYPTRGIIYDRNDKILVGNQLSYDLMVSPRTLKQFDTSLLAKTLKVPKQLIVDKINNYHKNRRKIGYRSVVMLKQLKPEIYQRFAEIQYKFQGFKGQARSIRHYPINAGGNLLGYVSEVDNNYIKKQGGEYKAGDYAGKTGMEASMEKVLRGEKGYHIFLRNSKNQIEDKYEEGKHDKEAVSGSDINTTIDSKLQEYGQNLMKNKVGSLIAIEPGSGEILAMVSSPSLDVSILSDIGKHYNEIAKNPHKPMFNRAVQAPYPPGSIFKLVNGLIGLQEGVLKENYSYPCYQGYHYGNRKLGCHVHKSPIMLEEAIMMSCNAYFCYVFKNLLENKKYSNTDEAFNKWREYVESFGFGNKLGSDVPYELSGTIPTSSYYDKIYGKNAWKYSNIISLSIGQGEIGVTPLQIANLAAIVANKGFYYIPHIIKDSKSYKIDKKFKEKHFTMVDSIYYNSIVKGMWKAVNSGFGSGGTASIAAVSGLDICGKTGTAQNPRGEDNSVFLCFAPKDKPKIAVIAYIENGGFGATWAAPIASLMIEKYLKSEVERKELEERIMNASLMNKVKTD